MISFKPYEKQIICKEKFANIDEFEEKLSSAIAEYGEENIALCFEFSRPTVRIFDGYGYFFLYPYLADEDEERRALEQILLYAIREEIGLAFSGVTADRLSLLCGGFDYTDVRREDTLRDSFFVRVKSEADLLSGVPTVRENGITLSGLKKKDVAQYARICRDESALEFWGYDYRDDEPFAEDGYFYDCQRRELERGTSVTFGVRYRGNLIGEAALYAFDYRGGAQISFRILPEYRGRGLGRKTLLALFSAAENIGLNTLYATVCNKNIPSTSLISQYMDKENEKDGVVRFVLRGE